MDAYVFIETDPGSGSQVMDSIVDQGLAARAVSVTGRYGVIARVEGLTWDGLGTRIIDEIGRVPGVTSTTTSPIVPPETVGVVVVPIWVPFRNVQTTSALVLINFVPGAGADVVSSLAKVPDLVGLALIAGDSDVMVQVAGSSFDEIAANIFQNIQSISGIARTNTMLILRATAPVDTGENSG
ncbi:MAG: Lrp/AsnC ligand binding domain-containing protein [Actinomycetota bacterium]